MGEERHFTRFLRMDDRVQKVRQHRGWREFHRQCGEHGLYFDAIEKQGRGYQALTFRVQSVGDFYHSYVVSRGSGREPIDAVLSAFHEAVTRGHKVDPRLVDLLATDVVTRIPDDLDALLGVAVAAPIPEIMDLIG